MKIPFSPPYIDEEVKQEVMHALESGWITTGPKVQELERLVAERVGVQRTVCCSSATAGLMLMLHWYGVGEGDEVIIPAYTYAATALVVMHVGAKPVMVDVDADTFNLDMNCVRTKITQHTKAIIPVDIAGWPCDYERLYALVEEFRPTFKPKGRHQELLGRMMILSDAAHSIGALYQGKPTGNWGDFTVFSFHAVKNVTTAEGGAICINLPVDAFDHESVYRQLRLWSLNGQTKDAFTKTQGGGWRYDIVYPGFKMNMPDICAAIGLAQLRKYHTVILLERRRVFREYCKAFGRHAWAQLPPSDTEDVRSSYHLFALRIREITEDQRDRIIDLVMQAGVSVNVHFQPLPLLTIFKERGYQIKDYPVAWDNYSREISLPIYPELDTAKIDYIISCVIKSYQLVING